ncbi:general substrate transporter [Daldinia grandis]|nr:general substrate transporter [Daldinia grandis]
MSLVNTNKSYLRIMNISRDSSLVGVIVAVYYLRCVGGAIIASYIADRFGRKLSIRLSVGVTIAGGLTILSPGIISSHPDDTWNGCAFWVMLLGRIVLGIGIGGIDIVIPVYSSELSEGNARGTALAKEFRANIGGLLAAFILNLCFSHWIQDGSWAWRAPILCMQIFPVILMAVIGRLPESPRWLVSRGKMDDARVVLSSLYGDDQATPKLEELQEVQQEEVDEAAGCLLDRLCCGPGRLHPNMITIMVQLNQAMTGAGAISVYGTQIFQLLGLSSWVAEYTTLGNYIFYFIIMIITTNAIDRYGRRRLMLGGSCGLTLCYTLLGFVAMGLLTDDYSFRLCMGTIALVGSTATFGACWLTTVWLIPTEIYSDKARAQGGAISVVVWGLANFIITILTPIGFNHLKFWLFFVFAISNLSAGLLVWLFLPETGRRSFQDNQQFFVLAKEQKSWLVHKVDNGSFLKLPPA